MHTEQGEPRTVGNLKKSYGEFDEAGARHKDAKNHHNVIHQVLFDADDDTEMLDILPPPELHLLLGVVLTLCTGVKKNNYKLFQICNNK